MNPESYRTFNRRGREQELTARPLLVLYRGESTGSHNNQKQNKKPFTQISLQNRQLGSMINHHESFCF